jgi:hypothetical protein
MAATSWGLGVAGVGQVELVAGPRGDDVEAHADGGAGGVPGDELRSGALHLRGEGTQRLQQRESRRSAGGHRLRR